MKFFSFQDFFLKRGEKKIFFQEKTLKKKRSGEDSFLPTQPSFPPAPLQGVNRQLPCGRGVKEDKSLYVSE